MSPDAGLGTDYLGDGKCRFCVWAPRAERVEVRFLPPSERLVPLERDEWGYHAGVLEDVEPGTLYFFRLDGEKEYPDPASRFQPEDVHGPSQIIDKDFAWNDSCWFGLPLRDYIIYELHIGTYTLEGTFEAVIPHLDELCNLGVTAVEIMPVAQFPGNRNWGYDGAYPFAVQNSYGGPRGLKRLVNACHSRGLAVILDVVYNHMGPEGNYLSNFGPYFTNRYQTPWGDAVNYDGPSNAHVRRFFKENAIYWVRDFHFDALRIDAVHAILDFSAQPFLAELGAAVHALAERLGRRVHIFPESDLNDTILIRSRELGGFGLDAQWSDDFHHSLRTLLGNEETGYFQDFGQLRDLAKAYREGFVYSGQYSRYRGRPHGNSSKSIPAERFIVFAQNHDQVGNRMRGERLNEIVSFEALKLAAATLLLSPFIPLLFMGEEYGEMARFPYFISHLDPGTVEAVRKGRREEFAEFQWEGEPPDPQDESTFMGAKLNHGLRLEGHHKTLIDFYKELIALRKEIPALSLLSKDSMEIREFERQRVLVVRRWCDDVETACIFHYAPEPASVAIPLPAGVWRKLLDSADEQWRGPGAVLPDAIMSDGEMGIKVPPHSAALFAMEQEA